MADDVYTYIYIYSFWGVFKILLGCILVFSRMISTDLNPAAKAPETLRDLKKVHKRKSQMKGFYLKKTCKIYEAILKNFQFKEMRR